MRYAGANRRDLVDALHGTILFRHAAIVDSYADVPQLADELTLIWVASEPVMPSPNVVIVNRLPVREFLAWMHTYVPNVRPLTAFCRVVMHEEIDRLSREPQIHWAGPLSAGAAGIVAAECLGASAYADLRDAISCSFSLPIARSLLAGYSADELRPLSSSWLKTRLGATHEYNSRIVADFGAVWLQVAQWFAENAQSKLSSRASSFSSSDPFNFLLHTLQGRPVSARSTLDVFHRRDDLTQDLSREARLRALEKYIQQARSAEIPKADASLVLGYLVDDIAPGTLEHVGLAVPLRQEFPNVLAWYGFFAGLSMNSLNGELGGTWLHIQKQLTATESPAAITRADISAAEFSMLLPVDRLKRVLGSIIGNEFVVELAPAIYSTVKLTEPLHTIAGQTSLGSSDRDDALQKLEIGLRQVNAAYHLLAGDKSTRGGVKATGKKRQR
jgi:hypothetical protein